MGRLPAKDIIRQYRPVLRWRYDEQRSAVTATELGVARALVAAFGGDTPSEIPDFDDAVRRESGKQRIPAWMKKFEAANPGRVIQTG